MIDLNDAGGLDRLTALVLDPAAGWGVATVQVPAPRELEPRLRSEGRRPIPAPRRWLTAIRDELRRRTPEARRLPPRRRRRHVERKVGRRPIDLACFTERRGSPRTLVPTKTKGTYERALAGHHADLERLEAIGAMLARCEAPG